MTGVSRSTENGVAPWTIRQSRELAARLLNAAGVDRLAASQSAQALVLADVWGVHSHGLFRLPEYLRRLVSGGCNPKATLRVVTDRGAVAAYDGEDGLGHWQLWRAAQSARDRCASTGIAAVAVGRSSHCGALGVYTLPMLQAGQVGIVFSHGPAVMPPWEGSAPVLSTSPLAAGIPCRPRAAIVDLAMSAVARGRIMLHAERGEPLADGWAFTTTGEPTTDARVAIGGMLAPLGGAKGFALALLVEMLTAAIVGPALSMEVVDMFDRSAAAAPQRIAHLVLALDPAPLAVDGDGGQQRLDRLVEEIVAVGGRVPGANRSFPTELDEELPLELSAATRSELREWTHRLGAPTDAV